jgi:hypothetical protein
MTIEALIDAMAKRAADTPDTPRNPGEVSAKPAPRLACTPDTPDTPQNGNARADTEAAIVSHGWLIHFADREPLEVYFNPDASFRKVMRAYPDALAAVPLPERARRSATESEAMELRRLILATGTHCGWAADDFEQALDVAMADAGEALTCWRLLAAERGVAP